MESKKVTLSSQVCIICSLTPIKITFFYPYAIILKNYAFSYCWASFESCPFKFSVGHVFCLVTSLLPYMEEEENIAFFQQMAVSHHFPASPLTRPLRCFFLFDCVPHECLNPCVCVSICARFRVYVVYSTKLGAVVRKRRTLLPRRTVLQWFVSCVVFVQNMKIFLLFFFGWNTHRTHMQTNTHIYTNVATGASAGARKKGTPFRLFKLASGETAVFFHINDQHFSPISTPPPCSAVAGFPCWIASSASHSYVWKREWQRH